MNRLPLIIIILFMVACSATGVDQAFVSNTWPEKHELFDNFRSKDTVIIVYGKEDVVLSDLIVNGLGAVNTPNSRFTVITRRDDKITEQEVINYPLYVLGTNKNLVLNRLNDNLPIRNLEVGFEFDGKIYTSPNAVYKIAFYPNVFNPKMPITVISGNKEQAIIDFVQQQFNESWGYFYWDNWGYQIFNDGKRAVLGNFSEDSANLWTVDKKMHWEFNYDGEVAKSAPAINYYRHDNKITAEQIDAINQNNQLNLNALTAFIGKSLSSPVNIHIYPKAETKALMLSNADQSLIDVPNRTIHTVISDEYTDKNDEALTTFVCEELIGLPKIKALEEGLAVRFTNNWLGCDYKSIAAKLVNANAMPTVKDLINNEIFEGESDYLSHIAAASFVDFLINNLGDKQFLQKYLVWDRNNNELIAFQSAWYAYAAKNTPKAKTFSKQVDQPFLKGFNYAHEGYQIYNGYMGSQSDASIAKLKEMGVNTLSIIPYSSFYSMTEPNPIHFTSSPGSENDASIIRSAYVAHENGMSVMLKPQLWSHLGWTGDITMQNKTDWDLFFAYYEKWILHYALMAEIYQFEYFCIGVEFQNASLSEHNRWDALFEKVRAIYDGKITYAANWGKEFETVSFWDKLDFISVNCYYPLSEKQNPTDQELLTQFEKNLDIIENVSKKYSLPVVFTEIGFKSIAAPWIAPHKDDDTQEYSEESQQRCYKIMASAMADENWIKGVYLWKWPSHMDFANEYRKDFTPCGKLAEKTISEWFLFHP